MNKPYGNAGVGGRAERSKPWLTSWRGDGWDHRQAQEGTLLPDRRGERRLPRAPFSREDEDAWGASLVPWQLCPFPLNSRMHPGASFGNLGLPVRLLRVSSSLPAQALTNSRRPWTRQRGSGFSR